MDKKALQLLSRFSLPPNALGYCGKDSAPEKFKKCVLEGKCSGVSSEIKNFIVLNPYLKTISEVTGKDIFSYQVAETYWLGNSLLKKSKAEDYEILLKNLKKQGVPDWIIKELDEKNIKKFIPFHLFQILNAGVGRTSIKDPYNIKMMNNCMVRWGKVKKVLEDKVVVKLNSLDGSPGKYKLVLKEEEVNFIPGFVSNIKAGDMISVHWGLVVKKLTERELENLKYWTKETIKIFN
ncbi:hypothetical protein K0B04_03735 [Patescibacteria group bacterium]|nr:hypothetical protein [Patescibacteria group bacterium]